MNAQSTLRPSASSPSFVAELSAITSPFLTFCPTSTIGFWLTQVSWFDRWNLMSLYSSTPPNPEKSSRSSSSFRPP